METVEVGELVLTHRGRMRPVLQRSTRFYRGLITRLDPTFCRLPVVVTPEHLVWSAASTTSAHDADPMAECDSESWCEARLLSPARPNMRGEDLVRDPSCSGCWLALTSVGNDDYRGDVHDLEVAEDGSYCVEGIAVASTPNRIG